MRRREFMVLGGSALVCPGMAYAKEPKRPRLIGVLTAPSIDTTLARSQIASLHDALEILDLRVGRDIDFIHRGGAVDPLQAEASAKDLVAQAPDVIVVASTPGVAAVLRQTTIIPIVFVNVADPQGSGFVKKIEQPGGSVTGFTNFELSLAGKWVQLIKEIAPTTQRILALYDPATTPGAGYIREADAAAGTAKLHLQSVPVSGADDFRRAIKAFAGREHGAMMIVPDNVTVANSKLIIGLAREYALPAVYGFSFFAAEGGLITYGLDSLDLFRRAAEYVARILRGESPATLPVQAPTKYQLVINLRTARALGLTVSAALLAQADEVIE